MQNIKFFQHDILIMIYTIGIETCCPGMKTILRQGTMKPYVTQGSDTGQMFVRGNNNMIHDYDQIKHCLFCGKKIRIIDR